MSYNLCCTSTSIDSKFHDLFSEFQQWTFVMVLLNDFNGVLADNSVKRIVLITITIEVLILFNLSSVKLNEVSNLLLKLYPVSFDCGHLKLVL